MELDLLCIGEILVDLTQTGTDERGVRLMAAHPGGAPANVAVAVSRLGLRAAFAGCVGDDAFGRSLIDTLRAENVDAAAVTVDKAAPTTLAVVTVNDAGERSFTFYRAPGADLQLRREQVPDALLSAARIVHFGSLSLTADPARAATLELVRDAKAQGALISFDPNYRASIWNDEERAKREMRGALPFADVVKISDEETDLVGGASAPEDAAAAIAAQGARLVLVTLGGAGVYYRFDGRSGVAPGFTVPIADTNGAGDSFFGAVLSRLAKRKAPLDGLTQAELEDILRFGNRAASLTVSRPGAIPALPRLEEVEAALLIG